MRNSRVEAGTPSFFAAPLSPATFPRDAVRAASIACRSSELACSVELPFAAVSIAVSKCNAPPRERITARSTTFSSSLTFPGQECDCSKSKVWRSIREILRPNRVPYFSAKCATSSGIGLRGATAVAPDFVREKDRLRYERQAGLIRLLEEKSALRPELTAAAARATSFGHSPAMIFIVVWWWSAGGALIVTKNGLAIRSCSLC